METRLICARILVRARVVLVLPLRALLGQSPGIDNIATAIYHRESRDTCDTFGQAVSLRNPEERALPLGASAFYILLALSDGQHHGAYISEEVERITEGGIRLLPGALYRFLKQMSFDRWIVESETDDSDGRRKYYRLTGRGKRVAQAEARRLDSVVRVARTRRLLPAAK